MSVVRFDSSVAPPGKDHFVIHLDLKHENGESIQRLLRRLVVFDILFLSVTNLVILQTVLMCEATTVRNLISYPTLKVADWGLAEYTSREDVNNSKVWKFHGTIVWFPPVSQRFSPYIANQKFSLPPQSN